jgi:hypothetical protein
MSFTSKDLAPMSCFIHYPPSTDVEAYTDVIPPTAATFSTLSSYSDACWGSQIGSVVADGTLLPLFKFQSMSGGIDFKNVRPLGWLGNCQECTELSSCEAEIHATRATSPKVVNFRNLCRSSLSASKVNFTEINAPAVLYNDNDASVWVWWSPNMPSKAAHHIQLCENAVHEWVQDKTLLSNTLLVNSIWQTYSPRKCGMEHTFGIS